MRTSLSALILAAIVAAPVLAFAQPGPGSNGMGPPPEMRAKMESLHAQAKTDAYAALTADHRAKLQTIVAQVVAGSLPPREASKQINAFLTPDEQQSVGAIAERTGAAMHAAFAASGAQNGPPPGAPPATGAAPPNGGPPRGDGPRHKPTPGGFLLRVSLTPEQMHALRHAEHAKAPA